MTYACEFIVLNFTKVGDKSLVLHTLSRDWGRRSFITGISRKSPMALFQPLSLIEAEVVENPRSELWRIKEISASEPLNGLRGDVRKSSMTLFMSEVLLRTLRDGSCEEGLFDWCRGSILTLDALSSDFSNYHLLFLLEFTAALGFSPATEDLAPFAGEYLGAVRKLLTLRPAEALLLPLGGEQRNAIAALLLDYIGTHAETNLRVQSLQVLRELFR